MKEGKVSLHPPNLSTFPCLTTPTPAYLLLGLPTLSPSLQTRLILVPFPSSPSAPDRPDRAVLMEAVTGARLGL